MAYVTRPKLEEWITGDNVTLLLGWLRDGLSNIQIAKNIGISEQTFYRWCKRSSEFRELIKNTKEYCLSEVENSLFKSANGFMYDEVTYYRDPETGNMIEAKRVTKMMKPDVTAQIFIMKTRRPENYSQNSSAAQTTEEKISDFMDTISDELTEDPSDGKS